MLIFSRYSSNKHGWDFLFNFENFPNLLHQWISVLLIWNFLQIEKSKSAGESTLLSNKKFFFASSNWFNMGPQSVLDLYKIMSNFETKNTSLCIRNCSILKSRRRSSFFLPHWPLTVHNGLLLPNSKECDVR